VVDIDLKRLLRALDGPRSEALCIYRIIRERYSVALVKTLVDSIYTDLAKSDPEGSMYFSSAEEKSIETELLRIRIMLVQV
jgi:hypothetical protein